MIKLRLNEDEATFVLACFNLGEGLFHLAAKDRERLIHNMLTQLAEEKYQDVVNSFLNLAPQVADKSNVDKHKEKVNKLIQKVRETLCPTQPLIEVSKNPLTS